MQITPITSGLSNAVKITQNQNSANKQQNKMQDLSNLGQLQMDTVSFGAKTSVKAKARTFLAGAIMTISSIFNHAKAQDVRIENVAQDLEGNSYSFVMDRVTSNSPMKLVKNKLGERTEYDIIAYNYNNGFFYLQTHGIFPQKDSLAVPAQGLTTIQTIGRIADNNQIKLCSNLKEIFKDAPFNDYQLGNEITFDLSRTTYPNARNIVIDYLSATFPKDIVTEWVTKLDKKYPIKSIPGGATSTRTVREH